MKTTLCNRSFMSFDIRIEVAIVEGNITLDRGQIIKNAKAIIKNHVKTGRASVLFIFDCDGVLMKIPGEYVSIIK